MTRAILLAVVIAVLTGCAAAPKKAALTVCAADPKKDERHPSARHHTIYIDRFGNLICPDNGEKVATSSNWKNAVQEERAYIDNIIKRFDYEREFKRDLKLTVHIHGGLNVFRSATARSDRFSRDMLNDGQFPVFICWDSGPFTNYLDRLYRIRGGESDPIRGILSSPFVLVEDILRSLARAPTALYKEAIGDPLTVSTILYKTETEKDYEKRIDRLTGRGFQVQKEGPYVGIRNDYYLWWNPVKFVMAPFRDGLGTAAWDSMLRRTDLVLSKSEAYEGTIPKEQKAELECKEVTYYADTAATYFLQRLEGLAKVDPGCEGKNMRSLGNVKLVLIGHSMGAIVANNVLARHPDLNFETVVFMGGAARLKDVENVVVPWLRQHREARFVNLSLDPYREVSENVGYDFVPHGSLLNWIDHVFGEVNSFKDLTVGSWWNIGRLAEDVFPPDISLRSRIYLTRFPIGGEEMGPQTHGDFSDYCFWQEKFWMARTPLRRHPACAPPDG